MRVLFRTSVVGLFTMLAACGSGPIPQSSSGPRRDSNYISAEELRANRAQTAYDAVQSMRANWLRKKRGEQSFHAANDVIVYLDNAKMGGLDALRQISTGAVVSMRFFDPAAANYRWGAGHSHGAILVSTGEQR